LHAAVAERSTSLRASELCASNGGASGVAFAHTCGEFWRLGLPGRTFIVISNR